jgi:hypothetical protein
VVKFPKVDEPNFVHKSRGQAVFFEKNPTCWLF